MPYANVTYTYDSALDPITYSVPFEFLKNVHLKAKVDVAGDGTYVADTGFDIASDGNSVTFSDADTGGSAWVDGTTKINIYRETPIGDADRIVDFQSGSVLTEADLDNSALQVLYAAQESADVDETVLKETAAGTEWDAESQKLINLADPTLNQDAATKLYVDTVPMNRVTPGGTNEWDAEVEKIINVVDPTSNQDAATKKYVDDATIAAGNLPDVSGGTDDNHFLVVQTDAWAKESVSEVRSTLGLGTAALVDTGSGSGQLAVNSATSGVTSLGTAAGVDTGTASSDVPLNSSLTTAAVALALPACQWHWGQQSSVNENADVDNVANRILIAESTIEYFNNGGSYFDGGTADISSTVRSIEVQAGLYAFYTSYRVRNNDSSNGFLRVNINREGASSGSASTTHLQMNAGVTVKGGGDTWVTDSVIRIFNFSTQDSIALYVANTDGSGNGDLELSGTSSGQIQGLLVRLGDSV